MSILNYQEYCKFCNNLTNESQEKLEEFKDIKLNFVIKHIKFSVFRKGDGIMHNNLSFIAGFEFVKAFYLKEKNIISEEDFQNTIFNFSEHINKERLLKFDLMEEKNGQLSITPFGRRIIEYCSITCEDCGETVYFNIFSPRNTCLNCGKVIISEYRMVLGEDDSFRKYNDTMS